MRVNVKLCFAITLAAALPEYVKAVSVSWKFIQPPQLTLELFWKKSTEHHYHNASTKDTSPVSSSPPIDLFRPSYPTFSSDAAPAYDTFGTGGVRGRGRGVLEDDGYNFEPPLYQTRKTDTKRMDRDAKTIYIQLDLKNNASPTSCYHILILLSLLLVCCSIFIYF